MAVLAAQRRPLLAAETREAMAWLRDLLEESLGCEVDSGGGLGGADFWFTRNGVEFYLTLVPSNAELSRHGAS